MKKKGRHSKVAARKRPRASSKTLTVQDRLAQALTWQRAGRWAQAERAYAEILAQQPNHADALHLLGVARLQQGALEEAGEILARAVDLRPDSAEAQQNLAEALRKLNRLDEAKTHLRRALALRPDYARAHSNLGRVLSGLGRWDEARASLQHAIALKPDYYQAYHHLGETLRLMGKLEEAETSLRRALGIKPDDTALYFSLGITLQELGRLEEAAACYARILTLDPDHDGARNNLGLALPYLTEPQHEVTRQREVLAENIRDANVHRELGAALWKCRQDEDAQSAVAEALRLEPESAATRYYRGLIAKTRGDSTRALDCFRQTLSLDPSDVHALAAIASIEAQMDAPTGGARVALFLGQPFHYGILRPVFDALSYRHRVLLTPHVRELEDFDPDVIVVAESVSGFLRRYLPQSLFVWVRHGLISKNTTCFAAREADFACLTSEASKQWYIARGGRPRRDFWITGYPQLDPLFRGDPLPVPLQLSVEKKTVLYAPTWTKGLSSAPMLGERVVDLIRGNRDDVSLVVKPHPVTALHHPEWLDIWRELAASDPDVHLIDDPAANVIPYLQRADILVSDASSVIFQYLALDRPIVLLTNPGRREVTHFDPNGIEWQWRDVGAEVHDVDQLAAAVSAGLDDPTLGSDRRAHYRRELFGDYTDGRAAERIAERITELGF